MQKRFSILISAMTLAIGAAAHVGAIDLNRPGNEHDHEQEHEKQKYTCPMHPEVVTEHPGNCPKCGMKLGPVPEGRRSTSNAQRPMLNDQSHIRTMKCISTRLHTRAMKCTWKCVQLLTLQIP
jgi:hypothetical protein